MLYPSINELISKEKQCRYSLVIAVAKEARDLAAKAELNEMRLEENPIHLAVDAFADGKVQFREPTETQDNP